MPQPQPSPFDVIRSLDKRRREYRRIGWVYMLKNNAFKKPLLKIGRTARPPMERAHELGTATGVPEGFELVYFVHVAPTATMPRGMFTTRLIATDRATRRSSLRSL